jgi:hypothetical protein
MSEAKSGAVPAQHIPDYAALHPGYRLGRHRPRRRTIQRFADY